MSVKNKIEVKHVFASGVLEDVNQALADLLNAGWELKEARFVSLDESTRVIKVFYLIIRNV